jgi:hypothetical protein
LRLGRIVVFGRGLCHECHHSTGGAS